MPRHALTPLLLIASLPLAVAHCSDVPSEVTTVEGTAESSGSGTTGADSGSTGPAATTVVGGTGDTGGTGLDDTGTTATDESSEGSTGDPLCSPEDPGCGCDGIDVPDFDGLDENNDGIDGLAHCSVFVSSLGGDDGNDGLSMDEPVATIARAIEISQTFVPPRAVLVAESDYAETVTIANGTSLYGGYDASTWSRDVLVNETIIVATESRALIANDIDQATEVDGFTIVAVDFAGGGQSSYGIWVDDAVGGLLHFDYCTIEAGTAGQGDDAGDGLAGPGGSIGAEAILGSAGVGGASACGAVGGNGGNGDVCPSEDGQPGMAGGDPTAVGAGGSAGSSNCDGCFDSASPGLPGLPGSLGLDGMAGAASADLDGQFSIDGFWIAPLGDPASRGVHGGGGGGGGAGGFDSDPLGCDIALGEEPCSGGGGGGGSGGCGGEGGDSGGSGGGSFAMVVIDSDIEVTNSDITLGTAGDGGVGGDGGDGGGGAVGGAGAPPCPCNSCGEEPEPGDAGGTGAGGGGGGGGPGGCGGMSVGVASVGLTVVATSNVSFGGGQAGAPGEGGLGGTRGDLSGSAPDGPLGCMGVVVDERNY